MERLQKVIAHSGFTSRRKAEQLILDGKVKVNNTLVMTLGTKVSEQDIIEINGTRLKKEEYVYYLLHKPKGVISSVKDDQGREVVVDLLDEEEKRVYPIGRLDYLTSGILLLTNDGEFANLLMHPRYEIEKVYTVEVKGIPRENELQQLINGVKSLDDILKAIDFEVVNENKRKKTTVLEITLHEGKNRHIRRMFAELGYPVMNLKRKKYGFLSLNGLASGDYRSLSAKEVSRIKQVAIQNVEK